MEVSQKLKGKTASKMYDNKAGIAGTMGVLSGQMIPESEDYHDFIRTISMPRDEEYLQLVARQIELLNRKEELLAELAEMRSGQDVKIDEIMSETIDPEGLQKRKTDKKKREPVKQETAEPKTARPGGKIQTPSKEEVRKKEIEAELKRLEEEAAFLKKNLEDMFPESGRMLCMIYPTFREGALIRAGVIRGRGWGFDGPEELCDIVKPETKREQAMLVLGDSILQKELYEVLNIEIYPEAVCVVYPNGLTKVYR